MINVLMMPGNFEFEAIDLGVDIEPEVFAKAIAENKADILSLTALLSTTMPIMLHPMEVPVENGIRAKVMVIEGGTPVNHAFADKIDADPFSEAGSVAKLAKSMII